MEFKEIVKDILVTYGYSQQKLADELNVNQTTVSQWLLGHKKPSYDSIEMIYKKFKITPNEVFGIE